MCTRFYRADVHRAAVQKQEGSEGKEGISGCFCGLLETDFRLKGSTKHPPEDTPRCEKAVAVGRGGVLQSIQTIRKTALFQFETGLTPSVGIACGKHAVTHFKYIFIPKFRLVPETITIPPEDTPRMRKSCGRGGVLHTHTRPMIEWHADRAFRHDPAAAPRLHNQTSDLPAE